MVGMDGGDSLGAKASQNEMEVNNLSIYGIKRTGSERNELCSMEVKFINGRERFCARKFHFIGGSASLG